jgi:hypothetical protein
MDTDFTLDWSNVPENLFEQLDAQFLSIGDETTAVQPMKKSDNGKVTSNLDTEKLLEKAGVPLSWKGGVKVEKKIAKYNENMGKIHQHMTNSIQKKTELLKAAGKTPLEDQLKNEALEIYKPAISATESKLVAQLRKLVHESTVSRVRNTEPLKKWASSNPDKGHPTKDEKQLLAKECELTVEQVSAWFSNHGRKKKQKKETRIA